MIQPVVEERKVYPCVPTTMNLVLERRNIIIKLMLSKFETWYPGRMNWMSRGIVTGSSFFRLTRDGMYPVFRLLTGMPGGRMECDGRVTCTSWILSWHTDNISQYWPVGSSG